nr:unnamed protein product [Digitaria exilis]
MKTASMQKSVVCRKAASRVAVSEAYVAAATAALHPNPAAVKEFLASPDSVEKLEHISYVLLRCVHDGNQIMTFQFHMLCTEVSKCASSIGMSHQPQEPNPTKIDEDTYLFVSVCIARFWHQHSRVFIKMKVALEDFNKTMASNYQFHVICGVNELVCGPHFCPSFDNIGYNPWTPHRYLFSHANFLATTIDDAGNQTATLFFAEFDNHGTGTRCVPIAWSSQFAGELHF